ncbi:hypothetical protein KY285_007725 [Solanum tuberosum]|nr:hypothetical protein KY285_007725 [Solanum tuberosum]
MAQPKGYANSNFPNHVCHLKKSIYGKKQAPYPWYKALKSHLTGIGYILEILLDVDTSDYKGVATPMFSSSPPTDAIFYRRTLFMQSPSLEHLKAEAVKRVLRYLKSSITLCLQISRHSDRNLHMYVDADWVGDCCDRISTSNYILFLGPNPICWSSGKQQSVA